MTIGQKNLIIPKMRASEIIEKSIQLTDHYLIELRYPSHKSVFKGVTEVFGITYPSEALRLLSGFNAGGGFTGHLCGALCGGIAVLGYIYGSDEPHSEEGYTTFISTVLSEDMSPPQKAKKVLDIYPGLYIYNMLINRFKETYGYCNCAELVRPFHDDLISRRRFGTCRRIVSGTAGLVSTLILDMEQGNITPTLGDNIYSHMLCKNEPESGTGETG